MPGSEKPHCPWEAFHEIHKNFCAGDLGWQSSLRRFFPCSNFYQTVRGVVRYLMNGLSKKKNTDLIVKTTTLKESISTIVVFHLLFWQLFSSCGSNSTSIGLDLTLHFRLFKDHIRTDRSDKWKASTSFNQTWCTYRYSYI